MKAKTERVRMVSRTYTGISVFKKGADQKAEKPLFFPNMGMSQVLVIAAGLDLDMGTAKADIRKYSIPESEFLRLAKME